MKCRLCGQKHKNREETAAAHTVKVIEKTVVAPAIIPEIVEIKVDQKPTSKAGNKKDNQSKKKTVKYRGRSYEGIVTKDGVEITLKSGAKRTVKDQ